MCMYAYMNTNKFTNKSSRSAHKFRLGVTKYVKYVYVWYIYKYVNREFYLLEQSGLTIVNALHWELLSFFNKGAHRKLRSCGYVVTINDQFMVVKWF